MLVLLVLILLGSSLSYSNIVEKHRFPHHQVSAQLYRVSSLSYTNNYRPTRSTHQHLQFSSICRVYSKSLV
jgi:hypothetical protein